MRGDIMMSRFRRNYLMLAVIGLFSLAALSLEASTRKFDDKEEKDGKGSELVEHSKKQKSNQIKFTFQLPDALVTYMLEFCNTEELLTQLALVSKQFYNLSFPAVHSLKWPNKEIKSLDRLANFKRIKSIDLERCSDLTDEDLKIIAKHCPRLRRVNLAN